MLVMTGSGRVIHAAVNTFFGGYLTWVAELGSRGMKALLKPLMTSCCLGPVI